MAPITGVATSITAFLGRTARGPVDSPLLIHSFSEFEQIYGGLSLDSSISYAVRDFFANGGRQAVIQRIYRIPGGEASPSATLSVGGLNLLALSPGAWGKRLRARVLQEPVSPVIASRFPRGEADLFKLEVFEEGDGVRPGFQEHFLNLSIHPEAGEHRADRVLEGNSKLVRVQRKEDGLPDLPDENPAEEEIGSTFVLAEGGADSDLLLEEDYKMGLESLDQADLINLLCIPPDQRGSTTSKAVYQAALAFCVRRRAMLLVDPPPSWAADLEGFLSKPLEKVEEDLGLAGIEARNAALYFPPALLPDPLQGDRLELFPPSGLVAGLMARIDEVRGVWKAPAGTKATLNGVVGLQVELDDPQNGILNRLGINCLRVFPGVGPVVWGSRTLRGADHFADEYKYVPVRRLALFIEESIDRGTGWAVFEPNDEPTWAQIRRDVNAFLQDLFLQGAFAGRTPPEAYFVKCGEDTMTQDDIDNGNLIIEIGIAPIKPAEFVIIRIQKRVGQESTCS